MPDTALPTGLPPAANPPPTYSARPAWPLACARARQHLAQRIHGSLGQLVAAVGMTASRLARPAAASLADDTAAQQKRLSALAAELADAVRQLEASLHPVLLDQAGLAAALHELLASVSVRCGGMPCTLEMPETPDAGDASADALLHYRLIESLLDACVTGHPHRLALTVHTVAAGTEIALTLDFDGESPDRGTIAAPAADTDRPFAFLALDDWLAASGATLCETSPGPARRRFTVTLAHQLSGEAA